MTVVSDVNCLHSLVVLALYLKINNNSKDNNNNMRCSVRCLGFENTVTIFIALFGELYSTAFLIPYSVNARFCEEIS